MRNSTETWLALSERGMERAAKPDQGGEWVLGAMLRKLGLPALILYAYGYISLPLFSLPFRAKKKSKPLNLKIHSSVGSCENIPSQQRSPLLSERSLRSFFVGHGPFLPSTPPVHTEANFSSSKSPGTWSQLSSMPRACSL